ncbi:hypothetical protein CDO52_18575 [Nocardiopsis gilva YIM 90087]|uniref:Uncharacterized protein n=1 Tax=Nocardiopsis gilva YIM 90087 TaxID=1235441 RepID=A0A223S8U5_9ACTN|nr:hypothetical protein [Nocardiopsis gilva]ASU84540.1 hypothetical protein CDO52_18575 [Nocardiopsis gilva YIM 90087]
MADFGEGVEKLYSRWLEMVREPTESGQLTRQVIFFLPVPLPVLALVAIFVGGSLSASGWMILLSGSVAVAALLLAIVVQPTPLPEGLSAEASVRRSLHRFRQITSLRIALALTPVAVGAGASIAGGGMLPLLVALAMAWPQLVLASPLFFTITRARRAMEAWGTKAYLWAALAQPAPVEWPIATELEARYRVWEALRAAAEGRQEQPAAASAEGGAGDDPADHAAATTDADVPTTSANSSGIEPGADLPERLAVTSSEPKPEPGQLIPGFELPAVSVTARRVLRSGGALRRKARQGRGGNRRPKTRR